MSASVVSAGPASVLLMSWVSSVVFASVSGCSTSSGPLVSVCVCGSLFVSWQPRAMIQATVIIAVFVYFRCFI